MKVSWRVQEDRVSLLSYQLRCVYYYHLCTILRRGSKIHRHQSHCHLFYKNIQNIHKSYIFYGAEIDIGIYKNMYIMTLQHHYEQTMGKHVLPKGYWWFVPL